MQFIQQEKLNLENDRRSKDDDLSYCSNLMNDFNINPPTLTILHNALAYTHSMKFFKNFSSIAKNKYLLTIAVFAIWMIFFDTQDIISTHFKLRNELNQLQESRNYYVDKIEATKEELDQLKSDPATLEKYAREKYRMKKDSEDLFIIAE